MLQERVQGAGHGIACFLCLTTRSGVQACSLHKPNIRFSADHQILEECTAFEGCALEGALGGYGSTPIGIQRVRLEVLVALPLAFKGCALRFW